MVLLCLGRMLFHQSSSISYSLQKDTIGSVPCSRTKSFTSSGNRVTHFCYKFVCSIQIYVSLRFFYHHEIFYDSEVLHLIRYSGITIILSTEMWLSANTFSLLICHTVEGNSTILIWTCTWWDLSSFVFRRRYYSPTCYGWW